MGDDVAWVGWVGVWVGRVAGWVGGCVGGWVGASSGKPCVAFKRSFE